MRMYTHACIHVGGSYMYISVHRPRMSFDCTSALAALLHIIPLASLVAHRLCKAAKGNGYCCSCRSRRIICRKYEL